MFHEYGYKPCQYTPIVLARNLCCYEFNITDNKNKFPEYDTTDKKDPEGNIVRTVITIREDSILNRVRQESFDIYNLAFTANIINLNRNPERKIERLEKQQKAISLCETHFGTMELCCMRFKQSPKRIKHWGLQIKDVQNALMAWHESDIERYKNI